MREARGRLQFDRQQGVYAARMSALDRLEKHAEEIYRNDDLSPRERRRRLAEVSEQIDALNDLI